MSVGKGAALPALPKLPIGSGSRHQLLAAPLIDEPTAVQHEDAVRSGCFVERVGDRDGPVAICSRRSMTSEAAAASSADVTSSRMSTAG